MGGTNSRDESCRRSSSIPPRTTSSSWEDIFRYPPQNGYYSQDSYPRSYPPPENSYDYPSRLTVPAYGPPQPRHHGYPSQNQTPAPQRALDRRYSRIGDNYRSLDEVTDALSRAGLESSNLIVGIDFTKSNEWTGKRSYNGRSLHQIGNSLNPYEQAISIIGKTLAAFDEDNLIPCYGFGDASTHDRDVFSFYPEERFCNGFEEVLSRYREIIPHAKLAGPTSFAPVIEMAMTIVEQNGGQYHVLVIIADGQVTRSVDTGQGQLSPQERKTVEAIVKASKFPLSIILVGVGDGPWGMMKEFDDNIPCRDFDNFQFVNFTEIMSKHVPQSRKETEFALAALMEIPSQYKATIELGLLGGPKGNAPERVSLPPPLYRMASFSDKKPSRMASFQRTTTNSYYDYNSAADNTPSASYYDYNSAADNVPSAPSSTYDNQLCPVCRSNSKDMAFACGHQTCCDCGQDLHQCPICRTPIQTRIKLY